MNSDYTNYAQPWQDQQQRKEVIPASSNNRWFYAHHPFNWELAHIKKGKKTTPILVPQLKTIQEMPGVNGVRDGGDNTLLMGKLRRQGYNILDPNVTDYIRVYPAQGGNYYTSKFDKLENLAGRLIKTFQPDQFLIFRMGLVASNAVNLPHDHVLKLLILDQQDKINKYENDQLNPAMKAKMEAAQQKLEDIKTAIAMIKEKGVDGYAI